MTAAQSLPIETIDIATLRFGVLRLPIDQLLDFPAGIPGFPDQTRWALLPVRDGVAWLQAIDLPALAFLLVEPGLVVAGAWADEPDYWAIVTLGDTPAEASANLLAPLRIDRRTGLGGQEIRTEAGYTTAHRFDLSAA
ncbi:MAG TPA: flagellar assembly protein FliW [Gemmatimonadales bacterium]|nr:flagellar assembly protein FliW [Gemmatimonadales bacterium]HRX19685.1 flagellar assembly protein FliW [Gemmatimonadales bacterium]